MQTICSKIQCEENMETDYEKNIAGEMRCEEAHENVLQPIPDTNQD